MERGFVVYRGALDGQVHEEYVFRYRTDAEQWRAILELEHLPIVAVGCSSGFVWRFTTGSLKGFELADRRFAIYPDAYYEADPYRAHVLDR